MDEEKTVWCGNLSEKVTEEHLYELFMQIAPLQRVNIPQDKEGRKSNFAFIVFKHAVSVNYATDLLSGTNLFDKPLNIKPRSRNQGSENRSFNNSQDGIDESPRIMNNPMQNNTPYFDSLLQMATLMNASEVQPTYSSSLDYRQNNFRESRMNNFSETRRNNFNNRERNHFSESRKNRNYCREKNRKPYSRPNRNNGRNFDRERYY